MWHVARLCNPVDVRDVDFRLTSHYGFNRSDYMLWTIIIILLVLWALGFGFAGQAVGNLVHILLVIAVVVLVLQLVRGRRV